MTSCTPFGRVSLSRRFGPALCLVVISIRAAVLAAAPPTPDDWPCWRGPTHDGQASAGQVVPHSWGDAEHVVWTVDVPGRGNGSPTVMGSRVYLATCDEATGSQSVLAYDRATGKPLWHRWRDHHGSVHERSSDAVYVRWEPDRTDQDPPRASPLGK